MDDGSADVGGEGRTAPVPGHGPRRRTAAAAPAHTAAAKAPSTSAAEAPSTSAAEAPSTSAGMRGASPPRVSEMKDPTGPRYGHTRSARPTASGGGTYG